jgi:predicted nucleotidyltransferase component of viral defense system
MLSTRELREKSERWGVPVENVDKDWVLGHVIHGVFKKSKNPLVFKGGTCLRKAYFPEYRFSEDLDFSSIQWVTAQDLQQMFAGVLPGIYERVGIRFGRVVIHEELYRDKLMGYRALIPFWGSSHPRYRNVPEEARWRTSVKVDVSLREELSLPVVWRTLLHPYSDFGGMDIKLPVYSLEEIFAEKWRSLFQRSYLAPRDCYDLWFIWSNCREELGWTTVRDTFLKKCALKGIDVNFKTEFLATERAYRAQAQWIPSLGDQLKEIPPVDEVLKTLSDALSYILGV